MTRILPAEMTFSEVFLMEFTLHCGDTTARVRQKGAQMTSFKGNDNREVIWQALPKLRHGEG